MKKSYCIKCNKYKKYHTFFIKTLVLSIACDRYSSNYEKFIKEVIN